MKVICEKGIQGFFEEGKAYTLSENGSVMTDKTSMASYQRMGQTNRFVCEFGVDVAIFSRKEDVKKTANSHYFIDVRDFEELDVYAICKLYGVKDPSGVTQHAIKKLLCPGVRNGGKTAKQDMQEAIATLKRGVELMP